MLIGVPFFFLTKGSLGNSSATLLMILVMLPFFMFAMYERNGEPLEVYLKHFIQTKFIRQKERPYQTNNFYDVLSKQEELRKEVKTIVTEKQRKEAHKSAKA